MPSPGVYSRGGWNLVRVSSEPWEELRVGSFLVRAMFTGGWVIYRDNLYVTAGGHEDARPRPACLDDSPEMEAWREHRRRMCIKAKFEVIKALLPMIGPHEKITMTVEERKDERERQRHPGIDASAVEGRDRKAA